MLVLKASRIHGVGVFTSRVIRKGEDVGDLLFPVHDWKWARRQDAGKYGVQAKKGWYVPKDPHRLCCGWFLNHSATPNIQPADEQECWRALRRIEKGEELTIDYDVLEAGAR